MTMTTTTTMVVDGEHHDNDDDDRFVYANLVFGWADGRERESARSGRWQDIDRENIAKVSRQWKEIRRTTARTDRVEVGV